MVVVLIRSDVDRIDYNNDTAVAVTKGPLSVCRELMVQQLVIILLDILVVEMLRVHHHQ